jgi:hypothetical protein
MPTTDIYCTANQCWCYGMQKAVKTPLFISDTLKCQGFNTNQVRQQQNKTVANLLDNGATGLIFVVLHSFTIFLILFY